MVVFLWCFCGVFVVFLWWCSCGGVFVVVFLWWCLVVVFLWWCSCRCVCAVVFLWLCFCGCVFVVVFLWCSCGGVSVVVFLWCFCSNTTLYYKVLLQYYSVLQSIRTTSFQYYSVQRQYYKSFQNEHFVRGFRNFSRNKLPKRAFRARLPPNFTDRASKTSVSRDASDNFHRKSFQKDRFVRGFLQISQKKLPKRAFRAMLPPKFREQASKTSVSRDASDNFHRKSFQNDRFVRGFFQISQNKLPKRAFRAMLPTIFTKNLRVATVSRYRHTDSCERVHPPKAKCASRYNAVHSQM